LLFVFLHRPVALALISLEDGNNFTNFWPRILY